MLADDDDDSLSVKTTEEAVSGETQRSTDLTVCRHTCRHLIRSVGSEAVAAIFLRFTLTFKKNKPGGVFLTLPASLTGAVWAGGTLLHQPPAFNVSTQNISALAN